MGTRPPSLWPPSHRKRAGSDRSLHSPLRVLCATLKETLGAQTILKKPGFNSPSLVLLLLQLFDKREKGRKRGKCKTHKNSRHKENWRDRDLRADCLVAI